MVKYISKDLLIKKLLFLLISIISLNVCAAKEMTVFCERTGNELTNQFDLVGMVHQNNDGTYSSTGVFSIILRKNGINATEVSDNIEVDGTIRILQAGSLAINEVIQFRYVNTQSEAKIKMINILGNLLVPGSSMIRTKSGREYKSNCMVE